MDAIFLVPTSFLSSPPLFVKGRGLIPSCPSCPLESEKMVTFSSKLLFAEMVCRLLFFSLVLLVAASDCNIGSVTLPGGSFSGSDAVGQLYQFSLCTSLSDVDCSDGTAVCQQTLPPVEPLSCGAFDTRTVSAKGNVIEVTFTNGTMCMSSGTARQTTVSISCDPNAFGFVLGSITEPSPCNYLITGSSRSVCTATQASCTYFVPSVGEFDLSKVPVISGSWGETNNEFPTQISLCNSNLLQCGAQGNSSSYICQNGPPPDPNVYSLGRVKGVFQNPSASSVSISYSGGDFCASVSRPRSSTVHVLCAQSNTFINGTESSTCQYEFYVGTPYACPKFRLRTRTRIAVM